MPNRQPLAARVDTPEARSLSFAPLDRPVEREQSVAAQTDLIAPARAPDARPRRRPAIVVAGLASTGGALGMSEYPVQISKVQAPPLREETLARDRLLDWLSVKIHRRAVLLTAEAGYGKTTLLADFSRRTRLRVLWFRLDRGDRDWVGFLAYLVAAVRIHVPDFGSATASLLRETATSAPSLDTVLDTFLRELSSLPNEPTAIVFDDFHLVDDAPDVRHVLRELMTRGPERMCFVFASRREPPVRLARLRALGEVAELHTDDLRFDAAETERLFRETYDMRLEPAVLAELSRRTEGWAASLQLVRAALHDRNAAQIRAFISSLSGAEGHLYEYLAEEVVGELPTELQQFLMQTAVLETVDLVLGPVAAEVDTALARTLIEEGERHGLFGKSGPNARHIVRAHPLVRDFLQDRLARTIGADGVRALNLRVAIAAERVDWRVATRHYLAAGDEDSARRVLEGAIEIILATGAYSTAQDLAASLSSGGLTGAAALILRSRLAQQRADAAESLRFAEEGWTEDQSRAALLNLATARMLAGDMSGAVEAGALLEEIGGSELAEIGRAYQLMGNSSLDGHLESIAKSLRSLGDTFRDPEKRHFLGVALLSEALVRLPMGEVAAALECADEAIGLLRASSAGVELVSARLARASALAHLGNLGAAREELREADSQAQWGQLVEVATEAAEIEEFFGSPSRALVLLQPIEDRIAGDADNGEKALLARGLGRALTGDPDCGGGDISRIRHGVPRTTPGFEVRRRVAIAILASLCGTTDAVSKARDALDLAETQGAWLWGDVAGLLIAMASSDPDKGVADYSRRQSPALSMVAEVLVRKLPELSDASVALLREEAAKRPDRWREPIRAATELPGNAKYLAASILEEIGEYEDVSRLRAIARRSRDAAGSQLGRRLARTLAPRVLVEDLGRVRITVGTRVIEGSATRRKVLSLLCFLLTRPRWAATREEAVDSLWPDLDPQAALNSLNQTVYFLRRVFEPDYRDDTSPGYVDQDGEAIWLDSELIAARSATCLEVVRNSGAEPDPESSVLLAREYRGRFAEDFLYEDWASSFRDALHVGYLRVIESAIRLDVDSGNYARGIFLAERANEVEPDSEELQLGLARIYRMSGARAAAAEQYARYAKTMNDLGVQPVALGDL